MRKGIALMMIAVFGLLLSSCATSETHSNPPDTHRSEVQGDWPIYAIEEMLKGRTDLIALAQVDSVSDDKDPQIAELRLEETFYGQSANTAIRLYQSTRQVQPGHKYLLFLSYREEIGQYVVSDGLSQTEVDNDKLQVKVKGIEGEYTIDQFKQVIEEKEASIAGSLHAS